MYECYKVCAVQYASFVWECLCSLFNNCVLALTDAVQVYSTSTYFTVFNKRKNIT